MRGMKIASQKKLRREIGCAGSALAQWVGFEPTSLKGHRDFEQIIKLPIWSLIVLKKRRFSLILNIFLREFGNLREKCEKTARNFRRLKRKMKGKSDHEQGRKT